MIQKNGGCNNVRCRCGHSFRWNQARVVSFETAENGRVRWPTPSAGAGQPMLRGGLLPRPGAVNQRRGERFPVQAALEERCAGAVVGACSGAVLGGFALTSAVVFGKVAVPVMLMSYCGSWCGWATRVHGCGAMGAVVGVVLVVTSTSVMSAIYAAAHAGAMLGAVIGGFVGLMGYFQQLGFLRG